VQFELVGKMGSYLQGEFVHHRLYQVRQVKFLHRPEGLHCSKETKYVHDNHLNTGEIIFNPNEPKE